MNILRAFVITAIFLGLVVYEEGLDSAWQEVEPGLLILLWAVGLYLNIWWITNLLPRRVYTINLWRWRLVAEPEPDTVSRTHPWYDQLSRMLASKPRREGPTHASSRSEDLADAGRARRQHD